MNKLTKEQIDQINSESSCDQGIFSEPYGIPDTEKRLVIYSRYDKCGVAGGSCWGTELYDYHNEAPKDHMAILDEVLKVLCPSITYLEYKEIEKLKHNNEKTTYEYYGNESTDFIEWIVLDDLYELLNIS